MIAIETATSSVYAAVLNFNPVIDYLRYDKKHFEWEAKA